MAVKPINKQTLKNHWHYSKWKYILLCLLGIFGVNILFTMTKYRVPEDKKIEIYMCSGYADAVAMQEALWPMLLEIAPEQEELTVANIDLTGSDPYTRMQYTTYTAAQQGDILFLPYEEAVILANNEADYAMVELTPYIENGMLNVDGFNIEDGYLPDHLGEKRLYLIPAATLYGLLDYSCDPWGAVLCVTSYSGNEETAIKTLNMLLETMRTEKPEGYDRMRENKDAEQQNSTQLYL
ncbi:MAG: hypothetical protein J6K32_07850 [Clostridia bacterium]|nr:hypothetical protein [Clostridia bacterium]